MAKSNGGTRTSTAGSPNGVLGNGGRGLLNGRSLDGLSNTEFEEVAERAASMYPEIERLKDERDGARIRVNTVQREANRFMDRVLQDDATRQSAVRNGTPSDVQSAENRWRESIAAYEKVEARLNEYREDERQANQRLITALRKYL